jgi:glycosyltransferase involved in cell wall biosynthesis|tara:strand:+ start:1190 stop:2044 length:855 start_codon:yes stop_codon:yes gene_type:complete
MVIDTNLHDISVIIPTLDRRELLKRTLDSVIRQTKKPREIIVVDNGSKDQTYEMVSSLFSNVIYLKENKKGVSVSRNKGILSAKSKWIALLDSDDVWKPEKLEKQINFHIENPKYRLIHTNEIWYRNNKFLNQLKKHKKSGGNIFKNSLSLCCISPSSTLVKKEIFSDYGYFDESLEVCEDYDMWVRITAKEEVGYIEKPMVIKYGGHSDQLSKKYWGMDRFRIFSLEKNLNDNWFTKEQRQIVIHVLIKKLKILTNGANKRGNKEILKKYNDKLLFWINKIDE